MVDVFVFVYVCACVAQVQLRVVEHHVHVDSYRLIKKKTKENAVNPHNNGQYGGLDSFPFFSFCLPEASSAPTLSSSFQ